MGNYKSVFSVDYSQEKKVTLSWEHQISTNQNQVGSNQEETGANPEAQATPAPRAQCAVCMTAFSSPIKVLGCGHSFCYECLLGVWRNGMNRIYMMCPLCRRATEMLNRNPSRLPNNFGMMEVLGMQVVDTTDPELDERSDNGDYSVSAAPSRHSRHTEINSHVSSQYYPATIMTFSSISMEDYQIENVQGQLEDYMVEEEADPLEDNE